jgi:tetratricopeptide (TPR) repeat protein
MTAQQKQPIIDKKSCLHCCEPIHPNARICPHCHSPQQRNYWHQLANVLKWVGGIATIATLIIGIAQVNKILSNWREKKEAVSELVAASKMRYGVGDFEAAWHLIGEALALNPSSSEARFIQVNLAMHWARETGKFEDKEIVSELLPVLYRGAANDDKSYAADVMAHIAWLDWYRGGHSHNDRFKIEEQLRKALEIDKDNMYANVMWGYFLLTFSDEVDAEKIDTAMRHFDIALKQNRNRGYVREFQFRTVARYRPVGTQQILQLANDIREKGEDLCLPARRTILDVYKDLWYDDPHLEPKVRKVLSALPQEDLLETYRWCESRVDFKADSGTAPIFKFVETRLIENTGDLKGAAALYSDLLREIEALKPWSEKYRDKHKKKIQRFLEEVSDKE